MNPNEVRRNDAERDRLLRVNYEREIPPCPAGKMSVEKIVQRPASECQLCKSGVPLFMPGESLWKCHIVSWSFGTSGIIPCNEEERAKMEAANKRLAEMDAEGSTTCVDCKVVVPKAQRWDHVCVIQPPSHDREGCSGMGDPKPESTELSGPPDA